MRLGAEDANALLCLIGDLHLAATPEELADTCRAGLARLLPADLHDIVIVGTALAGEDLYLGTPGGYDATEQAWALQAGMQHPVVAHFAAQGDRGPVRVSDLLPLDRWRGSVFYRHGNARLHQDYEIDAILPCGTITGMAGLAVSREGRDFDARDRAILAHLRGPLGLALGLLRGEARRQRLAAALPAAATAERIAAAFPRLTRREAEVLHWIVQGKRDGEIATILGIRPATATTHTRNLLARLGVESRLAAAMQALARCRGG